MSISGRPDHQPQVDLGNGGGYFGVPLINFLGWTFTVYLFMQVFALYLRNRGPMPTNDPDRATASDL